MFNKVSDKNNGKQGCSLQNFLQISHLTFSCVMWLFGNASVRICNVFKHVYK